MNSFIKDTNHFLRKIKSLGQLLEGVTLGIIDVVGYYPNIPHDEALASLRKFLDARTEKKVPTETLLEFAEIVLKINIFQFKEKTLKQLRGTAIAAKFVPPYAIIFMADLAERILKDIELQPRIWRMHVDDIFFIWEHGVDSLKQFTETLNACHSTIKFTAEWSKEEINFLDVNVRLRNRQLETDLHIKPIDTHQVLDSISCHPYHCKKNIPYSQALRYSRICSDNKKFDQRCKNLEKWLMKRGYIERIVRKQILKARGESRDSSLFERGNTKTSESKLTFNTAYYPVFQNVRSIFEELQVWLAPDKEYKKVFPKVPIV